MNKTLAEIEKIGIIPVINIDNVERSVPLARALIDGGIPCVEITFRTEQAEESLRQITKNFPKILAGAGTIINAEQVDRALDAGAEFIVCPGFNPKTVEYCLKKQVPVVPGCSNSTDMELAVGLGLEVVKFFPAEQSGGLDFIKAVSAPFSALKFIPTGGINGENIAKYLAFDKILACGGTWMTKLGGTDLISAGNFEKITELCRDALNKALNFSVLHLGINTNSKQEAEKSAKRFQFLFDFGIRETELAYFASNGLEIMKGPGAAKHGHIAIGTSSILRAAAYLERNGIEMNYEAVRRDSAGKLQLIYLKEEIEGFAVHLSKKQ